MQDNLARALCKFVVAGLAGRYRKQVVSRHRRLHQSSCLLTLNPGKGRPSVFKIKKKKKRVKQDPESFFFPNQSPEKSRKKKQEGERDVIEGPLPEGKTVMDHALIEKNNRF